MDFTDVSLAGIVLATVANVVIGSIWYSPMAFGNLWMRLVNKKKEEIKGAGKSMVLAVIANFIQAYFLALFIKSYGANSITEGAMLGALLWVGFIATSSSMEYIFEKRKPGLYILGNGYQLVSMIVMGMILAVVA